MDMEIEAAVFLGYAAAFMIICFFGRLLLLPVKLCIKMLKALVVGGFCLILFNILGAGLGASIPLNILTALISGLLGVPGVIMLFLCSLILC